MVELDLFRDFRRGVAAPTQEAQRRASARLASALAEATVGGQGTRLRRGGRHRRVLVLAAAVFVVVMGTATALGGVRALFIMGENPMMSEPSIPWSISWRHGQMPYASGFGHGMCQKMATFASGRFSLIIDGRRARW